jgi:hypothetical protein
VGLSGNKHIDDVESGSADFGPDYQEKVMKVVASTDEYTVIEKRNGRYAVRTSGRRWINGDEKVAILLEHKLITAAAPKAPEPEAADEPAEDAVAEEATSEESASGEEETPAEQG